MEIRYSPVTSRVDGLVGLCRQVADYSKEAAILPGLRICSLSLGLQEVVTG